MRLIKRPLQAVLKPVAKAGRALHPSRPVEVFAPDHQSTLSRRASPGIAQRVAPPPLSQQTPEELAVRAQSGGGAAMSCFGELVTRFEGRLFNFLLQRTRSRSDAEELTQEAFARAWERIGTYDPAWKFSTWLYTIGSRLAISRHRKLGREYVGEGAELASERKSEKITTGRPDAGPIAQEDRRAGRVLWDIARQVLSEDQYTALWLRYAEEMAITEVARVMGKTQVGVRVSLFRARQMLATQARERGIMPFEHERVRGEAPGTHTAFADGNGAAMEGAMR